MKKIPPEITENYRIGREHGLREAFDTICGMQNDDPRCDTDADVNSVYFQCIQHIRTLIDKEDQ